MKYGWLIRGKRSGLFVKCMPGNVLLAFEAPRDATLYDTAEAALRAIASFTMAPLDLEVVDYAIHDLSPPDADRVPIQSRAEVIQAAKDADKIREAKRRATWGLVQKAVAVVVLAFAVLAAIGWTDKATASPSYPPQWSPYVDTRADHSRAAPVHAARRHAHSVRVSRVVGGSRHLQAAAAGLVGHDTSNAGAVTIAERYLGTNPTTHSSLWCADFANFVERQMGRLGTGSREALSFLRYGPHVNNPSPGDIVVLGRHGGGHVGFLIRETADGPLIISGNHGHRVGVGVYNARNVIAYVRPS